MSALLNSNLFRNLLGLIFIISIWLIFSIIGLRGVAVGERIKQIRQETGASILTLAVFVLSLLGLIALFAST